MSEEKKEEKKQTPTSTGVTEESKKVSTKAETVNVENDSTNPTPGKRKRDFTGKGRRFKERPKEEFEQRILDLARVTRVMKGGKRMSFRACVAIGDKKGRIAVALGKGADVTLAVNKAVSKAKKNIIEVPIYNDTIPHQVESKFGSAKLIFKPASKGRGVIAGGVVRVIIDLAGIKNVTSKILGTNNKVNNAKCTILAFTKLKRRPSSKKETEKDAKIEKNDVNKAKTSEIVNKKKIRFQY